MLIIRLMFLMVFFVCNISNADIPDAMEKERKTYCLPINEVFIRGVTLDSIKYTEKLININNGCIKHNDINALAKDITSQYVKNGYIAARVRFIPINSRGQLGLSITEGIVEKIEGGDRRIHHKMLFPDVVGKPLNVSQLDQAIDQAHRLQSNRVTLDIQPGHESDNVIVNINNINAEPWHLSTSVDNYGYKGSDKWRNRTSLKLDSPLGFSDLVILDFVRTLENAKKSYKNEVTFLYSVPYGALTLSTLVNYRNYRRNEKLKFNVINFNGRSKEYNFNADYVFYRNQNTINSISTKVEHKIIDNYIAKTKVGVNSHRLSALGMSLNQFRLFPNGSMNFNIGVKRGVPWFNTGQFNRDNKRFADGKFTTSKLSVNLNHRVKLFESVYQLDHLFVGQYSKDKTASPERIDLTARHAIRGFSRGSQSAGNGWYIRNTLSNHFFLGQAVITPHIGFDAGRALQHKSKKGWQSNTGISVGATLQYKKALLNLDISRGWWLSNNNKNEPVQLLTQVSYTF
ncbi:ShlB/FhaC/HecB family hemolysin secretion/activation protein [Yersinia proxima]|uniref:ShlB/FhaC/HecB family hemolysin secretion/activation protein n=4 Tax=Yersinia proxima TaxID=2890316 RepID=UPI001115549D|nr:ShlB/FhaC/HecB family hemolysin secretion/activation protein [Yersinia proxima]